MSIFMETTSISAEQTVGEIQKILGKYGAKSIQVEYEAGQVSAVAFILELGERRVPFLLPCRWEALKDVLIKNIRTGSITVQRRMTANIMDQAKRVAWRQILRWIEAQLAMVETKMVKMEEVFMPYVVIGKGQTLFQAMEKKGFYLEAPR